MIMAESIMTIKKTKQTNEKQLTAIAMLMLAVIHHFVR